MECFKFACSGCCFPEEVAPACDKCPCWKECECCIYYEDGFDDSDCDGYCSAYNCDIIHIN